WSQGPHSHKKLRPSTDVVTSPLLWPRDAQRRCPPPVDGRLDMSAYSNHVIFREPEQRKIGSLQYHLCGISPEIDGRSPVPGSREGQAIIISLPSGCPKLTDAVRLASVDESPRHRGASAHPHYRVFAPPGFLS